MAAEERVEFVFGEGFDPADWYTAGESEQLKLVEKRFGATEDFQLLIRAVLVQQLLLDKPPQVWATAARLTAAGLDADQVMVELIMAFTRSVQDSQADGSDPEAAYNARLDQLPLPAAAEIESALLDVAEQAVVIDTDTLVAESVEILGHRRDDPLVVQLVEMVEERLADDGPLAWLPHDRTAHVPSLTAGIVLTHVLNDAERTIGSLVVSFDLAGFERLDEVTCEGHELEPVSAEPGHLAWTGPDGWLEQFEVGATLAVRADGAGAVVVEVLDEVPPAHPEVVAALREAYDQEVREPGLPVSGEDLILGMLAYNRTIFSTPQAPLSALCEAAGLEKRASAVAHETAVWVNGFRTLRIHRVLERARNDDVATAALDIVDLTDGALAGEEVDAARLCEALDEMSDSDVFELVTDELIDNRLPNGDVEALAAQLLAAARGRRQVGVARLLAAFAAEIAGDLAVAEQHLELAVEADPNNFAATDRLAWYASDRGNAARAARLWATCPRSLTVAQNLATLEPFTRIASAELGRNERCWCGSGRKYKQCHLGMVETAPLADRVGWLCRKAVAYLERGGPAVREEVDSLAIARAGDPKDLAVAFDDPIVVDVALTEGRWFEEFLAERGSLLPGDEALLAASWQTVDRTVYEIVSASPGSGLVVCDLRTGDQLNVREHTFSKVAHVGTMVCARAVPDGESNQFVGGIFQVAPGTDSTVLDLLDLHDPHAIVEWVRDLHRPPRLQTREGEDLVSCEIVAAAADRSDLIRHLNRTYVTDEPGKWWTEHHDLDEVEAIVRARLHLEDDQLTITTNSNERADRILRRLHEAVAVTVVSDRRSPVDFESLHEDPTSALPNIGGLQAGSAVPEEAIAEIQERMEQRWCDESVPALGGLTPREAVADPTRREEVERLLASFDARPTPAAGFTLRTGRLRALLGL
jgi:hypothetical protein